MAKMESSKGFEMASMLLTKLWINPNYRQAGQKGGFGVVPSGVTETQLTF